MHPSVVGGLGCDTYITPVCQLPSASFGSWQREEAAKRNPEESGHIE